MATTSPALLGCTCLDLSDSATLRPRATWRYAVVYEDLDDLVVVLPVMGPPCGADAHVSGLGSEKVLPVTRGLLPKLHGLRGDRFP